MKDIIVSGHIIEGDELTTMYKQRKREYIVKYISKSDPIPDGCRCTELKNKNRISYPKPIDQMLQDQTWCLLYELSMKKLSDEAFAIAIRESDEGKYTKQIDVVAADNDFLFVVECKSRLQLGQSDELNGWIERFGANKSRIAQRLHPLLQSKLKPIFLMVTENIVWKGNNKLCAKEHEIQVFDEYDLLSLRELAKIAGSAAKYQLYNQFFYDKKIKSFNVQVPALESKMGGKLYYTFNMVPEHLLKIAYVHQRKRTKAIEFYELSESYQRMMKPRRLSSIQSYIDNGGFFPGSIILNFTRKPTPGPLGHKTPFPKGVIGDTTRPVLLSLPPYYGCAWVIDGQHRLYGFADTEKRYTETLPVVAFFKLSPAAQAKLFIDINKEQKSVDRDLLWDLYEDLYANSDNPKEQHLCAISSIAKKLNDPKRKGFFTNRISIPKEGSKGSNTIDLKTICIALLRHGFIEDEDAPFFDTSYGDSVDYAVERLNAYFNIFKEYSEDLWMKGDDGFISSTAGVTVLLAILRDLLHELDPKEIKNIKKFQDHFYELLDPLIDHLNKCSDDTLKGYTEASTGRAQSSELQANFTELISKSRIPGTFNSRFLKKYYASKKKVEKPTSTQEILSSRESSNCEVKGSLMLNIDRWIKGDGQLKPKPELAVEGVIRTIAAFLNTDGGDLVIGAIECSKFPELKDNDNFDFQPFGDYYILGIKDEIAMEKGSSSDSYERKIRDLVSSHLGDSFPQMLKINFEEVELKTLCHITVQALSGGDWCYVNNEDFYYRDGNRNKELKGTDIDKYKKRRMEQ